MKSNNRKGGTEAQNEGRGKGHILLYGDRIIQTESLVVPHKSMRGRLFVLVPLLDLDPEICEPGTGRPYSFYRENLAAKGQGIYTFTMKRYSLPHGTV